MERVGFQQSPTELYLFLLTELGETYILKVEGIFIIALNIRSKRSRNLMIPSSKATITIYPGGRASKQNPLPLGPCITTGAYRSIYSNLEIAVGSALLLITKGKVYSANLVLAAEVRSSTLISSSIYFLLM